MEHILDNPIYNALVSGNENLSRGNDGAKYFPEDIAPFAGLRDNSALNLDELYGISAAESFFILFTPAEIEIPAQWKVVIQMQLFQMVYDSPVLPAQANAELVDLKEQHVPDMLALTKRTNPGPFLSRTIEFGNYRGIFNGARLAAMAGQRLQPGPYIEISAVCTHPDFAGKGYAGMLLADQVSRILSGAGIPFLHVREDNVQAVRLYQKSGFAIRRKMLAWAIQKQQRP